MGAPTEGKIRHGEVPLNVLHAIVV